MEKKVEKNKIKQSIRRWERNKKREAIKRKYIEVTKYDNRNKYVINDNKYNLLICY